MSTADGSRGAGSVLVRLALLLLGVLGVAVAVRRAGEWATRDLTPPLDRTGAGIALPQVTKSVGKVADARVVARTAEPEWIRDLAGWVPRTPRTPVGRALGVVWASPSTVVGLVLGALSGAVPAVRDGVVLFAPVRGPIRLVLGRLGYAATTLGHVVLSAREPSAALMAHELVHTRQAERFGPLMGPVYWYLLARYGYARHPMERAARIAGRQARHREAGHARPVRGARG